MRDPRSAPRYPIWPRWLVAILAAYTILAVIYSVSTPIFEPPDEVFHFPLINYMADTGLLPEQNSDDIGPWEQEGSQPPLYYWLSVPLVQPVDRGDLDARQERNPHAKIGIGLAKDNHVTVLHDWETESFPWHDTALAVHLVRFLSIALSVGTVIGIYHIACLAVPGRPALHLTAVLLAAFNPMFLFISASINNDNLINLLSAWTLALVLLIWREGLTDRRLWALALLMAWASLSKLSGLALYPVAGLAVLLLYRQKRLSRRNLIRAGVIVVGLWAVIAGWWYVRNWVLYGEPTGTDRMIDIIGPRAESPSLDDLLDEFEGFRLSFWGVFGTLNVIAPGWLFDYADALSLLALAGLAIFAIRAFRAHRRDMLASPPGNTPAHDRRGVWPYAPTTNDIGEFDESSLHDVLPLLLLTLHILIIFAALVNWTRRTPATQGRLMFPALGALSVLAAVGLTNVIEVLAAAVRRIKWVRFENPGRLHTAITPLLAVPLVAPLVIAAVTLPFSTIRPAYDPPSTVSALSDDAIPTDVRFGPIELLGIKVSNEPVKPGGELAITLYWHPLDHTAQDMSFYVQVYGHDDPATRYPQEIGKIDSYPGRGLLRTTTWDLDKIYADTYRIEIDRDTITPVRPFFKVGWWHLDSGLTFAPTTLDGVLYDPDDKFIPDGGRIVGGGHTLAEGLAVNAIFSGVLRLNRAHVTPTTLAPGGALTVALEWEALAPVYEDFQILVHLIDPENPDDAIAQGDHAPLDGRWPVSAWVPRKPFVDSHTVTVGPETPPGTYQIAVGFYRLADNTRLPVQMENAPLPDRAILLQTVTIEER